MAEGSPGGPLEEIRVLELAGLGPVSFAAMVLADLGADVLRVERPTTADATDRGRVLNRGRRSLIIDLHHPDGAEALLALVDRADALLEGFRPGVMERLGVGPDVCLGRNPRLVYGRVTGWGQDGPNARLPGHDINFIALAGVLAHIGRADEAPVPPLNLLGDFGGGGMVAALGVVCALLEAHRSGRGQVVDAAAVDGAALLMSHAHGLVETGRWDASARGVNSLDTGSHFYDVYRCSDGAYLSVGSVEPGFYARLLRLLGLADDPDAADPRDQSRWPALKRRFQAVFATKSRDEWCQLLEHEEVCVAPVLTMEEAAAHPHNVCRSTFVTDFGVRQPAPAPRFSRTPGSIRRPPPHPGEHSREALLDWGVDPDEARNWMASGAVAQGHVAATQ